MARKLAGPTGNSPRDLRDDFVGEPADPIEAGEPPRWPRNPKRITKDTFHARAAGGSIPKRADRASHFRKGGWVRGGSVKRADGGVLSAAERQSLPSSDFARPGKGAGPKGAGSGSYPIPDKSHARNALARSSGKPVAAAVRAKVKAKFPGIGQKDK